MALGAIALTGAVVWAPLPKGSSIGVLVLIALFVTLVAVHARVIVRMERASAALRFHERGIARLAGEWHSEGPDGRPTGDAFMTPNHPYLGDLDIFGKASLFQLLDQTETRFGAAYLASWLKGATGMFPGDVKRRQDAVKDLSPRLDFRERLSAEGALLGADKPDPEPFLAWADGKTPLAVNPIVKVLAKVLPVFTLAAIFFYAFLPTGVWAGLVVLQILVGTPTRARVAEIAASVSSKERALARYADMLAAIENEKLES
ncbi:MAG: MutS-related protein family 1, partial [Myxococcaceae bacterium]|nr:MutS-related protein family 1 [Myxococcaceae bacterium]